MPRSGLSMRWISELCLAQALPDRRWFRIRPGGDCRDEVADFVHLMLAPGGDQVEGEGLGCEERGARLGFRPPR